MRKKTNNIKIHLSAENKKHIIELQKKFGFRQLSPFLHFLIFKNKKKLKQLPPQAVELKGQLRMIGVNVNQIAHNLNKLNFEKIKINESHLNNIKDNVFKLTKEISAAMEKIDKYFTY